MTVDGAVKQAGTFPVAGPTSLMQAVALAGGRPMTRNARRVAVFRTIGGSARLRRSIWRRSAMASRQDPQIYPEILSS